MLIAISTHGCIATALVGWNVSGQVVDADQNSVENIRLKVSIAATEGSNLEKEVSTDSCGRYQAKIITGTKCTLVLIPWILMSPPSGPPIPIPDEVAVHSIDDSRKFRSVFPNEETKHRLKRSFPWPIAMGGEITLPPIVVQSE